MPTKASPAVGLTLWLKDIFAKCFYSLDFRKIRSYSE